MVSSDDGIKWFMSDYNSIKDRFNPFSLYVWLGTCDLSHKQVKYISLKDSYNRDAAKLILNYKKLAKQASELNFSATFLEIAYYLIVEWNRAKGHELTKLTGNSLVSTSIQAILLLGTHLNVEQFE